jgi:ribosome-associated protein
MNLSVKQHVELAAKTISEKKGRNILALDVRGLSSITDYMVIAEGTVTVHVIAIARQVIKVMAEQGIKPNLVEGLEEGEWVVLDYPGFMVHIFVPSLREKYQLEQLWPQSTLVDLPQVADYADISE